jgi:hypothetical protein
VTLLHLARRPIQPSAVSKYAALEPSATKGSTLNILRKHHLNLPTERCLQPQRRPSSHLDEASIIRLNQLSRWPYPFQDTSPDPRRSLVLLHQQGVIPERLKRADRPDRCSTRTFINTKASRKVLLVLYELEKNRFHCCCLGLVGNSILLPSTIA